MQEYARAALLLAAIWAIFSFAHPAVRRALLDGARCLGRYPDLWRLPALFGFGYAIFQVVATATLHWRLQESLLTWVTTWTWEVSPAFFPLFFASLLPAAEKTSAAFTIFTATFPLSAVFALLLLVNFRGLLVELVKSLRRRLGAGMGIIATAALLITAFCALIKPAVYLFLPEIAERFPVSLAMGVNFLSIIFELLLGVYFLTYLMLMAYAWRRGLFFQRDRLLHLAMRRTGFVLKWSVTIALLEVTLVTLPLYAGIFLSPDSDFYDACAWFSRWIGRSVVIAAALLYCPMQATLVFHNESLRLALRDSMRLLRTRWASMFLFLGSTYLTFLLLETGTSYADSRLGPETAAALGG
ncbi:MAG TPA: hypothetical protein VNB29_00255, partial [Chthoniobacterales bacterium]|nr:hypothetical protein [Chthoniobacterales bacterium]